MESRTVRDRAPRSDRVASCPERLALTGSLHLRLHTLGLAAASDCPCCASRTTCLPHSALTTSPRFASIGLACAETARSGPPTSGGWRSVSCDPSPWLGWRRAGLGLDEG